MADAAPVVRIEDLQVCFMADEGKVEAVRGVSFDIPRGKTVALVGESGSGKSVLAQAILGILPKRAKIERGRILFQQSDAQAPLDLAALDQNDPKRRAVRGGQISIIFQEPMSSLSPVHTIGNQIQEALTLHQDVKGNEARAKVVEMLRKVGFPNPETAPDLYPFELSGGLRQRAMIAMALICRPSLLIADEPTTALDVTIQAQILKLMQDLQAELQMAILFITHDLGVVANIADEVVVMYRGRVMEAGTADDIFRRAEHPYVQGLERATPRLDLKPGERLVPLREVKVTGDELSDLVAKRDREDETGPILELEGVTKVYQIRNSGPFGRAKGGVRAAADVGFTIMRGESFAVVGESGSGKTTVSKAIMRAIDLDAGRIVYYDGDEAIDVRALEGAALRRFRTKVQYVFQDPYSSLNPRMTVADLVAEPLLIHDVGTPEERLQKAAKLLRVVGLDARYLRRYPHSFSGGQRQRIGIARALALGPDLLICDEPVSALDVSVQAQILNLLKDLQRELHLTYLFIAHNLAVVRYVADRVAVMCRGRIVELAPTEILFGNPKHPYTNALLAAVPEPDLDRPLNFQLLIDGNASDPQAWPAPYALDAYTDGQMVAVGPGHFVRHSQVNSESLLAAS